MPGDLNGTMAGADFAVSTIGLNSTVLATNTVLFTREVRETPLNRSQDSLATRELELGTTESLKSVNLVGVLGADGHENLLDGDTGSEASGLTPRTTHTSLETICSSAGQHLVDADNVPWVDTDAKVESILSAVLHEELVGSNASGFQSLRRDLFLLKRDEVDTEGEVVNVGLLTTHVVDAQAWVGHITAVTRLDVGLVLAEAVAASRSSAHFV